VRRAGSFRLPAYGLTLACERCSHRRADSIRLGLRVFEKEKNGPPDHDIPIDTGLYLL
jgi:hypothetical protein